MSYALGHGFYVASLVILVLWFAVAIWVFLARGAR
jgi:hypothetical protein